VATTAERELMHFWAHQSEEFLDSDPSGMAVVCWTGMPTWLNALYHYSQRVAFSRLVRHVPIRGKLILDVGTGVGRWIPFLLERGAGRVIGIDIEPKRLLRASERQYGGNASFGLASAAQLPFTDSTFDFVSSVAVLLHLDYESKRKAIAEIARITKPGGYVGMLELIDLKTERPYVFPLSRDDWVSSFEKEGLRLVKVLGNEYFPLLRLAASAHRLVFRSASREKRDGVRIGGPHGLAQRSLLIALRMLTWLSYPVEWLCRMVVPPRMARANGFLFVRDSVDARRAVIGGCERGSV
jgi:SAM-dependent methyltransferase